MLDLFCLYNIYGKQNKNKFYFMGRKLWVKNEHFPKKS